MNAWRVIVVGVCLSVATQAGGQDREAFEDASDLLNGFERRSTEFRGSGLGGAAWFDFDNDGDLDLFITNGRTQPNALIENLGNGTFSEIAAQAGVADNVGYSGVVAGDIDNDGFRDLFLTSEGGIRGGPAGPVALYHNNGDGTFSDITQSSGIVAPATSLSAAMADVDGDGFLDLFISAPGSLPRGRQDRNALYRNNGDLTFTDISAESGVDTRLGACAALFTDHNRDGRIDLMVVNCNNVQFLPTPIELFINRGDGTFEDATAGSGLDRLGYWMGIGAADFDNDGDIDQFLTNLGTSTFLPTRHGLFTRECDGPYRNVAADAGVAEYEFGWGCTTADFDNDGFADIFLAGSLPDTLLNAIGPGRGNPGILLQNDGGSRQLGFTETPLPVNLAGDFTSGVASGDYDGDGFEDIVVVLSKHENGRGRPILLHNRGGDSGWVEIRLVGTTSNRDAIGARVEVEAGDLRQVREVYAGSSFLSTHSTWLIFGIGDRERTDSVIVRWPGGDAERFPSVTSRQMVVLTEGTGQPVTAAPFDACAEPPAGQPAPCGAGILPVMAMAFVLLRATRLLNVQTHVRSSK